MIRLKVVVKDLDSQIDIIQSFLSEENIFSKNVANYFKGLENCFDLEEGQRNKLIKEKITKYYAFRLKDMQNKSKHLQKVWNQKEQFINEEFTKIFGREFNYDCVCYVNLNPVYPRYLDSKSYDINLDVTDEEFLSSSAHEITHFAWFDVWKETFPNTKLMDMEQPRTPWLISEIVVDPIFHFSNLKTLSNTYPAYSYFYKEKINDRNLIEFVREMYQGKDIAEFQKDMMKTFEKINTDYLIK